MWCYDNILVNVAACVIPGCVRACARARAVLSKQEHKSKKRSQSIYPPTYPLNKILFVTKSYIPIIKPTRCTNFSNLFWSRNLHVSDRFTVYHQESITVYTAIDICHTGYADCMLARSGCSILISLLDSWWWTVNLSETCRVLFQNKFEKSMHVVGFINIQGVTGGTDQTSGERSLC